MNIFGRFQHDFETWERNLCKNFKLYKNFNYIIIYKIKGLNNTCGG